MVATVTEESPPPGAEGASLAFVMRESAEGLPLTQQEALPIPSEEQRWILDTLDPAPREPASANEPPPHYIGHEAPERSFITRSSQLHPRRGIGQSFFVVLFSLLAFNYIYRVNSKIHKLLFAGPLNGDDSTQSGLQAPGLEFLDQIGQPFNRAGAPPTYDEAMRMELQPAAAGPNNLTPEEEEVLIRPLAARGLSQPAAGGLPPYSERGPQGAATPAEGAVGFGGPAARGSNLHTRGSRFLTTEDWEALSEFRLPPAPQGPSAPQRPPAPVIPTGPPPPYSE